MRVESEWTSPVVAATGLFLAGIIFGVAIPPIIPQQNLLVVLSFITAFGTLLLGVAAIKGVQEWSNQQRLLKQSERAEHALSYIVQVESHINDCKNFLPSLKTLPAEYDRRLTERWKSIYLNITARLKELSKSMNDDYTSAKKSMFWFSETALNNELSLFQEALNGLVLTLYVFPLEEELDTLDLSLPQNQDRAELAVEEFSTCILELEQKFEPIKSRLVHIANLH